METIGNQENDGILIYDDLRSWWVNSTLPHLKTGYRRSPIPRAGLGKGPSHREGNDDAPNAREAERAVDLFWTDRHFFLHRSGNKY